MFLQAPVPFTHMIWDNLLTSGASIIDATCGNGYDTLYLAQKALSEDCGHVLAFDIQKKAIEETEKRLKEHLKKTSLQNIQLVHSCHSQIEKYCKEKVDLIVFNLGYLPGSDKAITTESSITLETLKKCLTLLKNGAVLSITCYPGHSEGEIEAKHVLDWAEQLGKDFNCSKHTWINRSPKSPFLLLIEKK